MEGFDPNGVAYSSLGFVCQAEAFARRLAEPQVRMPK